MAPKKEEDTAKKPEEEKKEEEKVDEPVVPPAPPLEAAAKRLERLLGGGVSDKDRLVHTYSNPSKVVKRWLGTSSGAAGSATLADVSSAATSLLDPAGRCVVGREMIVKAAGESMDTESTEEPKYLSSASDREVEAWLISLAVRLLWKEDKFQEGFALSQQGITLLMAHLEGARVGIGSGASVSSLFPLLARVYRYRSLNADSLVATEPTLAADLRQDMVRAHGMACLRRDVDTQATLLNLMLHDLLNASQGMFTPLGFVVVPMNACQLNMSFPSSCIYLCSRTGTKAPL